MTSATSVSLELGSKKVFASAIDWPGWSRGARDEDGAIEALIGHGARYKVAIGPVGAELELPAARSDLTIAERLDGNAGTDFGVPTRSTRHDREPVDDAELGRLTAILEASWATFDRVTAAAAGVTLRKGPRGGGRELDGIVAHVLEAEKAYLVRIGGQFRRSDAADDEMAEVRRRAIAALAARVHDEPLPASHRGGTIWLSPYFVRRSAWHALDHAWEIEDRSER